LKSWEDKLGIVVRLEKAFKKHPVKSFPAKSMVSLQSRFSADFERSKKLYLAYQEELKRDEERKEKWENNRLNAFQAGMAQVFLNHVKGNPKLKNLRKMLEA
jgi:hypothetical protein